jgi:hypothetical protein
LSPKGEFWNRLERTLDLSKNVSEPEKNDLGNNPFSFDQTRWMIFFKIGCCLTRLPRKPLSGRVVYRSLEKQEEPNLSFT